MKRVILLFCLLLSICHSLRAQNISLIGQSDPFNTGGYQYGDVWAEGNIACVGVFSPYNIGYGIGIFDISNPAFPAYLANYYVSPSSHNQFEQGVIRNKIAYVGSWSGGGLHILSLTNPASPVLLCKIGKTSGNVTNGHDRVHTMFLERNFLYEADHATPVVKIFDVSNPSLPVFLWNLNTTNTARVHQITVVGNRLYTSGWGSLGSGGGMGKTDIWDVTNVGSQPPTYLGSIISGPNAHSSWPTDDNKMLVVCREIAGGDVGLYSITNPASPTLLVTINPASMGLEADTPHNPVIRSNLLFLSWYQNGIQVFDITDRSKPVRIGSYDTRASASTSLFQGNWGIHPNLGLDKILLSDMQSGLMILNATNILTGTNLYPPLLIKSPISLTATSGMPANFTSTFTGSSLKYQWRFNGVNISGATNSSYTIATTQSGNSGNYSVLATNSTGSVTSSEASLNVVVPSGIPTITSQPQSISVYPENSATFTVAVSGSGPFGFQWRFNGSDIPSATNNSFTRTNVQPEQTGNYSVLVSNSSGAVLSSNAVLGLIDSPYIGNVRVAPGSRNALISWSTSEPTDGQVQFEVTSSPASGFSVLAARQGSFGNSSYIDRNLSTNHTILLTGLTPETTYSLQIISSAGTNHYLSGLYQFSTAGNIILDNTNAVFAGTEGWINAFSSVNKYGPDYEYTFTVTGSATASATYTPNITTPGNYNVYAWYPNGGNRSSNARYQINYSGGSTNLRINQQINGGIWLLLATNIPFASGNSGNVLLYNDSNPTVVIADAIRFEYIEAQDIPLGNTVPTWWQTFFFGGSVNPNLDPDGDGYTTAREYLLGTSPIDPNSRLQMSIESVGGNANITFFPRLNDRSYELLYRSDVVNSSWQSVPSSIPAPNAYGEGILTVPTSSAEGFYRLRSELNTNSSFGLRIASTKPGPFSSFTNEIVCGVPNRAFVIQTAPQP